MEQYKNRMKKRLLLISCCLILYVGGNCIMYACTGINGNEHTIDFMLGFQFGLGFSILALLICFIIQYISALRNDDKLKKMYIAETDERKLLIYQKSGSTGMTFAILGLAIASVLAGYYDTIVFFSLLGACLFVALIRAILKLYYRIKY